MAQFDRFQTGFRNRQVLDNSDVIVTHVESPSLFFCRTWNDNSQFTNLDNDITRYLNAIEANGETGALTGQWQDKIVLAYSGIHKAWCRARIISLKHSIAKVFLMDYGSIELVLSKSKFLKEGNSEIANFNSGGSLCFPCKLFNVLPFDDIKRKITSEWSSYANFLMERETKDNVFTLKIHGTSSPNNVIVCDLIYKRFTQTRSLSQILVNASVAEFLTLDETADPSAQEDKENFSFFLTQNI